MIKPVVTHEPAKKHYEGKLTGANLDLAASGLVLQQEFKKAGLKGTLVQNVKTFVNEKPSSRLSIGDIVGDTVLDAIKSEESKEFAKPLVEDVFVSNKGNTVKDIVSKEAGLLDKTAGTKNLKNKLLGSKAGKIALLELFTASCVFAGAKLGHKIIDEKNNKIDSLENKSKETEE